MKSTPKIILNTNKILSCIKLNSSTNTEDGTDQSSSSSKIESSSTTKATEILTEANDALANVGWGGGFVAPITNEEMTSDDPFVQSIDEGIKADFGVELSELLNPAKVVNLERDLYNLRIELAIATNKLSNIPNDVLSSLTTEMVDDISMSTPDIEQIRSKIDKKQKDLLIERRAVFRTWLKNVFLGQAVLSLGVSWIMVTNPTTIFGGFSWFNDYQLDMPIRVLGFWWWWLFIVPSLRSRRPSGAEKKALDIAFLGTPLISIIAPAATKDPTLIWVANFVVVAASYGFAFVVDSGEDDDDNEGEKNQPDWIKFVYKSLDFGSGRERGARR